MSTWQEFYNTVKDKSWPDCASESQYNQLPAYIRQECEQIHGYVPGHYQSRSKLPHRKFPIVSKTACQLKWTWSTIYLTTGHTASCHRTNHHRFDTGEFDFHNTPEKVQDRQRMLQGQWPHTGCNYCQNIENAGGQSDRITNLNFPGIHSPVELEKDTQAVHVTPRMLEVYFDNTCNLKCLYCGPHFSSLWDAENVKHGLPAFAKDPLMESNKQKIFQWLQKNSHHLTVFNILGGEPLYQQEFDQCLTFFENYPAPELKLQIFSNLNVKLSRVESIVERIKRLVNIGHLREFEITASLDCWGPPQQYVRFPLNLEVWEKNFQYLLHQNWINLIINSTVTPLTIKTLPDLLEKINQWNKIKTVYHYQNSVTSPEHMLIDIFGNIFEQDFAKALALKPENTSEQRASKQYLDGIAKQSASKLPNVPRIHKLFTQLNVLDTRRGTNWRQTFPWLISEFEKYNLQ